MINFFFFEGYNFLNIRRVHFVIKLQQIDGRMRQGRRKQRAAALHTNRFVFSRFL